LAGKNVLLCPLSELGFFRISTNQRAINAPMSKARDLLERFTSERKVEWIPDDLAPLLSHPKKPDEVTDSYVADLAAKHGTMLATFDRQMAHKALEIIS
jgi:predicted nucleic acid-binding protein